ncbi:site-specific integrase [Gloeocapsopsis dulcis]|nr:site-specific integrase [Gloeocapsopsis dulcis]WNN89551.1 site-specific integrase [Gloeocapsopsis dulcis]
MLRCCYNWAIEQGLVDANPYLTIKLKKSPVTRIKPFTTTEILAITQGFEQLAPHYTPFVKFLFLTGVRLSEAIGLRWVDVDCSRSEITIAESLPKDLTGNGYTRIRKSTKTGSVRVLPMSQALRETLAAIAPTHELVFTSVGGSIIDADNFRMRHWKPILKAVAVPYRKIHNTRHTMISHALEQGIAPTGIAYLAGHIDTRMVLTTYGHMINKPQLPELF